MTRFGEAPLPVTQGATYAARQIAHELSVTHHVRTLDGQADWATAPTLELTAVLPDRRPHRFVVTVVEVMS